MSQILKVSRLEAEQILLDQIKEIELIINKVHDHKDFYVAFEDFVPELTGWREVVEKVLFNIFPTNEQSKKFHDTSSGGFLLVVDDIVDQFNGYKAEVKHEVGYLRTCVKLLSLYQEPANVPKFFPAGSEFTALQSVTSVLSQAKKSIVLVDGYIDSNTLGILSSAGKDITFQILTKKISSKLSLPPAIAAFKKEHGSIEVRLNEEFHDRFLVIDDQKVFQLGGSLKDLGGKAATIIEIQTSQVVTILIQSVQQAWSKSSTV